MASNYKMNYNVDIVFVIDSTGSMGHVVDMVKNNALSFHDQLMESMAKKQKKVDKLRARIIAFKDYLADELPMLVTDFYNLPEEVGDMRQVMNSITADGGGDEPEDALEALGYAIRSKWDTSCMKSRHIIALYTDASAHQLGFGAASPKYPRAGMARNISELTSWWDNPAYIKQSAKRLLLFAPGTADWNYISDNWSNVIHTQSQAGEGLSDIDFKEILSVIANSI